jgi:hypothetical protein
MKKVIQIFGFLILIYFLNTKIILTLQNIKSYQNYKNSDKLFLDKDTGVSMFIYNYKQMI